MELDPLIENSCSFESEQDTFEEALSIGFVGTPMSVSSSPPDGLSAFLQRVVFNIMFGLDSKEAVDAIDSTDPEFPQQRAYAHSVFDMAEAYELELKKCISNLAHQIQHIFESRGNQNMIKLLKNIYKYKHCTMATPHIPAKYKVTDPWTNTTHDNCKASKSKDAKDGKCVALVLSESSSPGDPNIQFVIQEDAAYMLRLIHSMYYITHSYILCVDSACDQLDQKKDQTFDQIWIELVGEKHAGKKASSWPQSSSSDLVKNVARINLEMQTVKKFINTAD